MLSPPQWTCSDDCGAVNHEHPRDTTIITTSKKARQTNKQTETYTPQLIFVHTHQLSRILHTSF